MGRLTPTEHDRLLDLLADRAAGTLSPDDAAEFEALAQRAGVDPHAADDDIVARVLLAADDPAEGSMPEHLRARLERQGAALIGPPVAGSLPARRARPWPLAAAVLIVASLGLAVLAALLQSRTSALRATTERLARMEQRIEANAQVLEAAEARADRLDGELAQAARRETDLARRLASTAAELDDARLAIARYETPRDPAELQDGRRRLLQEPGTVRIAWSPFDLPEDPAEQRQVEGDVVWNDDLELGYLRFVGLKVNDPAEEQYQVWVIDDRGMEQKVSGGVFNATAEGEVIVPIHPGIDVGRVALFAVTIEEPGGTWVPDLSRRVVVGSRDEG